MNATDGTSHIDNPCIICLNDAFEKIEGDFSGYTVTLDCKCKNYFHGSCIKDYWKSPIADRTPATYLMGSRPDRDGRTVFDDIEIAGIDPSAFEFIDIPKQRKKTCPSCSSSILEIKTVYNRKEDTAAAKSTTDPMATKPIDHPTLVPIKKSTTAAAHDDTEALSVLGAAAPPIKRPTVRMTGAQFTIHNARRLINELKEEEQLAPNITINESEIMFLINEAMAELDMASPESKKLIINLLSDPTYEAACEKSVSSTKPQDIEAMIASLKTSKEIPEYIHINIDLLQSFIQYELGGRNINDPDVQNRIIDFINSQLPNTH